MPADSFPITLDHLACPQLSANHLTQSGDLAHSCSSTSNVNTKRKDTSCIEKCRKGTRKKGKPYLFQAPPNAGAELDLRSLYIDISRTRNGVSSQLTPSSGRVPPSKILDFLYIGSVLDAQDAKFIERENIRCVLNISREEYWSVDNNIVVYPFKIEDSCNADITPLFRPTSNLIESMRRKYFEAKEKKEAVLPRVLVHCQKGVSRSTAIVMAYLIKRNGWSVSEALQYVRRRRYGAEPNIGFLEALRNLQNSMTSAERTRCYSQQSLLVKNLPSTTTASVVFNFFEKRFGCVKGVTFHTKSSSADHTPPSSQTENDREVGSLEANASGAESDSQTHVCDHITPALPAPKDTLCLVFFACFENVKFAKDFAVSQPAIMSELGELSGRPIKLIVPVRIKAPRLRCGSFNGILPSTEHSDSVSSRCESSREKDEGHKIRAGMEHNNSRLPEAAAQHAGY
ncbi:unnamed protein product [Phytomonas sp. EM1]|nr:unnamed protein product [Phytomonas sp. EM1]|eukprot:CCW60195.1 unnamed protein product [Phytomonas sp. isolate EM1]